MTEFNRLFSTICNTETPANRSMAAQRIIADNIARLSMPELAELLRCPRITDAKLHDFMIREALVRLLSPR